MVQSKKSERRILKVLSISIKIRTSTLGISRTTYMSHMAYLYVNDTCRNRQVSSASAQDTKYGNGSGISRDLNNVSSRYRAFQIVCSSGFHARSDVLSYNLIQISYYSYFYYLSLSFVKDQTRPPSFVKQTRKYYRTTSIDYVVLRYILSIRHYKSSKYFHQQV